ncbi:MAG: DnaJ domain-containing protein, partial [Candidatus Omnitrophica bacterium]|nr:DnaJ domain-containing protein [Candidatus Omnitrophota bacterium]
MADFKHIDEARKLLGLKEDASLEEIKDAYQSLSLRYHPDKCREENKKRCEEEFKRITAAKDVLLSYCANYRFSFTEQ